LGATLSHRLRAVVRQVAALDRSVAIGSRLAAAAAAAVAIAHLLRAFLALQTNELFTALRPPLLPPLCAASERPAGRPRVL